MKISKMEDVCKKTSVLLKPMTDAGLDVEPPAAGGIWGLGAKPQPLAIFSKKQAILMPLDDIPHMFRAI